MMNPEVPAEFICPITQLLMEYPFTTTQGNSYEHFAISNWLQHKNTDPKSNVELKDKLLIPNNSLRSTIQDWIASYPDLANDFRNEHAPKPPQSALLSANGSATRNITEETALTRVLRLKNCFEIENKKNDSVNKRLLTIERLHQSTTACGHVYTWKNSTDSDQKGLFVRCDNGPWIAAPKTDMFVTSRGIMFYDRTDYLDTRILPGTDLKEDCKFGAGCTKTDCHYSHPFVCTWGVNCRNLPKGTCKFLHPPRDSVIPKEATFPRSQCCRYRTACSNVTCMFAHPDGRMVISRQPAQLYLTHSLTLSILPNPMVLPISWPEACSKYQCQGDYVLSFEAYPGAWAKDHYRSVTVQRYDASAGVYRIISTYDLDRHYCNCAVAAGRYLVISFWPYEEEAIRTVWECLRMGRSMDKTLKQREAEIDSLRKEITSLKEELQGKECDITKLQTTLQQTNQEVQQLRQEVDRLRKTVQAKEAQIATKDRYIAQQTAQTRQRNEGHARTVQGLQTQLASARKQTMDTRRQLKESQRDYWAMQQRYEKQRNERLRLRDPIHIYALRENTSGFAREDWTLVLDYHKGAHELSLSTPMAGSTENNQLLEVVEHSTVIQFTLCVPGNMNIGTRLPLQPGRLCDAF